MSVCVQLPVTFRIPGDAPGAKTPWFVTLAATVPMPLTVPVGAFVIKRVNSETFRRICMSFDAWVVAFGVSRLLQELQLVQSNAAYLVLVGVGLLDCWLLYRFFSAHGALDPEAEPPAFPPVLPGPPSSPQASGRTP